MKIAHIINNKSDWEKFRAYYHTPDKQLMWTGLRRSFWHNPKSVGFGLLLEYNPTNDIYYVSYSDNCGEYLKERYSDLIKPIPVLLTPLQVFERFLKHHRKYSSYIRQGGTAFNDPHLSIINYVSSMNLWDLTKEGVGYWYKLHNKWRTLVTELGIKAN